MDSSKVPDSSGCHSGFQKVCSDVTDAAGWRSSVMNFASGQHSASCSQISTLLGVLAATLGLPLRWSASASTRSQSM